MSIQMVDSGRLLLVRWLTPAISDMDTILDSIQRAAARCGGPILYFGVTDARTEPPSASFCLDCIRYVPALARDTAYFALVDMTTGFKGSVMRASIAGMLLAARHPGRARVHARLEPALVESGATFLERLELLRVMKEAKLTLSTG